jgi:Cu2+-exporting ATPase
MKDSITRNYCNYCGLAFSGTGYSSNNKDRYCCYGCYLVERITGVSGDEGIASRILIRLGIGAFLSMNVMMLSLLLYIESPSDLGTSTISYIRLALAVIAAPAMVILGAPLAFGAVKSIIKHRFTMDAFIVTTSAIAYAVSVFHVYQGSVTSILTLQQCCF